MLNNDIKKYKRSYGDNKFWNKVKKYAKSAGKGVLEKSITIYYTYKDEDTPTKIKTGILIALGYFISPIDTIPDFIAGIGYTDDLGILVTTIASIKTYIKPEHKKQAKEQVQKLFES